MKRGTFIIVAVALLLLVGCHSRLPEGSLVLTQTPPDALSVEAPTVLDLRYPPGSRVVIAVPPFRPDSVRELSSGLAAAGDPCVSWDGQWVYFAGKSSASATWQIYRARASGGSPRMVTHVTGGAMDPALAAHGELVFSSPVPAAGRLWSTPQPAALYAQFGDQAPQRLTFGSDSAVGATALRDGRILFVSAEARDDRRAAPHLCLFTINNDGTEVTAYACQDDGASFVRRPRELEDGRVAFLAGRSPDESAGDAAQSINSAAPFLTRGDLLPFRTNGCRSVEPLSPGELLVCMDARGTVGRSMMSHSGVFRFASDATAMNAPIFDDPQRNNLEAILVRPRPEPPGHTTAVQPALGYATVLCLDVNDSRDVVAAGAAKAATGLRVFTLNESGQPRVLGQAPVAADGSTIVELPVNVPLGFDTLDAQGRLLRHQPAFLWLRPGENRGCVGCHEPRNHAPRNVRPLATLLKPVRLSISGAGTPGGATMP